MRDHLRHDLERCGRKAQRSGVVRMLVYRVSLDESCRIGPILRVPVSPAWEYSPGQQKHLSSKERG